MPSKSSLLLATALLLAPATDVTLAKGVSGGKGVSRAVSSLMSRSKSSLPHPQSQTSPRITQSTKATPPVSSGGLASSVSQGAKRTVDMVAPRDEFMRNYLAIRGAVAGAQYLALTPNNLAMVATAQYQTMLGHANVLPENHQTTIRIKRITDRLIQAIKHDPSINTEMLNRMKWEVHVIDAKTINAFCMPGGKMAIYTGIIDQLHLTDDEIAVVMGHEITHALREHSYTSMKTRLATNVAISAAGAYTGRHMYAADIANGLWQLSHSREHEREADTGGLDIVRMAGYDVCAGGKVWDKMQSLSKLSPTEFFSTHPASADRADSLRKQAERVGVKCQPR